jgi:outer membrane protein TolC
MKKTILIFSAAFLGAAGAQAADYPTLSLDLATVEQAALKASHNLKALQAETEAAGHKADASYDTLYPRLSAEANYRWLASVPEVKLNPLAPPIKLGDNNNWSLGLVANWDLFGGGALLKQAKAAGQLKQAKEQELQAQTEILRLRARLTYFQTQLAAERVKLLGNALVLAQSQADDLALRVKAGSSSRIDALAAANEELARRSQLRAARTDLGAALRDLYALSGVGVGTDPSVPSVSAEGNSPPANVEAPTLLVSLDSPENSMQSLSGAASAQYDPAKSARLRQLLFMRDVARSQAEAAATGHYPRASLMAKVSQEYPNGFLPESLTQETLGANASLPLFSFGAVSAQVREAEANAAAVEEREAAQATELERDVLKSRDRLASLKVQKALNGKQVDQTLDLARLVFNAYKIGGASYLEVQSASLGALEAGTTLANTTTQILIELATLDALSR